ncbi:MAG: hypothetical protein M3N97_04325 [Pseudomonadota bacterium]|nr:hypothetical protein [Pseudomonadota bacterium]
MKIRLPSGVWPLLITLALAGTSALATPAQVQVRIVTGAVELSAGSTLELRIYEVGDTVRRLPLTHGEAWPRDSTRVIPLTLTEPWDPRAVLRFGLYYRAANPLTPPWEVVSADVELAGRGAPQRLLNATLSGVIARQGELASEEREARPVTCATDADCDDHRTCNGHERCAPRSANADARGCVKGWPVVCPVNQVCTEERGCRGPDTAAPHPPVAPSGPPADTVAPASPVARHGT